MDHENVLPLRGFAREPDNICPSLISEWMTNGSLLSLIQTTKFNNLAMVYLTITLVSEITPSSTFALSSIIGPDLAPAPVLTCATVSTVDAVLTVWSIALYTRIRRSSKLLDQEIFTDGSAQQNSSFTFCQKPIYLMTITSPLDDGLRGNSNIKTHIVQN